MTINLGNALLLLLCCTLANAQTAPPTNAQAPTLLDLVDTNIEAMPIRAVTPQTESVEVSEEDLRQHPQLLERAYHGAILSKHIEAIKVVQPIYESVFGTEDFLSQYAHALLKQGEGDLTAAITHYRQLLAAYPTQQHLRLDLAFALFDDHQYAAAEDQFMRLKSEDLPPDALELVDAALISMARLHAWSFDVSAYYQQDDNINNAPQQRQIPTAGGTLTFDAPKSAKGLHFDFSVRKTQPFKGNGYGLLELNTYGNYWNTKDYNDIQLRATTGIGYQTATFKTELRPFMARRFYANNPYSHTFGVQLNSQYWLSAQWRLSNSVEISREYFDERKFLTGNRYFFGVNALYYANARQYWLGGLNYYRYQAPDGASAYKRRGMTLGWGQEWPYGISSQLIGTVAQSQYDGVDIFNILRKDTDYQARLTLWHRNIHWLGITPKLNYQWQQTNSNHFYYDQNKQTVYIELSKTF